MTMGNGSKRAGVLMPLALLGACAAPATHFGADGSAAPERSFVISGDDAAAAAVREALVAQGYEERDDGKLRVQVGFALRPQDLAVLAPVEGQESTVVSPAAEDSFSLCKRQAYVMTVALIERATGTIVSRGGATISRCNGSASSILPALARAALPGQA